MVKRVCGVNVPVFALRSKKGLGVGEFLDLIPFIDWCKEAGISLIQLLPINDTFSSHPYSIISSFALNPIYINLPALASEFRVNDNLNTPHLEYKKVLQTKLTSLKQIYKKRGKKDLSSPAFFQFFKKHGAHLKPYVAFCIKKREESYSQGLVERLCLKEEAKFLFFIQFHLHEQLKQVVKYAKKQEIFLKGDFPIGVHRKSVEVWCFPHYFRLYKSMGAPPDFYNPKGQNWGFPPYNWEEKTLFHWLKSRLHFLEEYFDGIRIDHVLGYFRLWENPMHAKDGLRGIFFPSIPYKKEEILNPPLFLKGEGGYHPRINLKELNAYKTSAHKEKLLELFHEYYFIRQEKLWKQQGREKLQFMQRNTKMQLFAEDIGVIPNAVKETLKELHIPNLYVQRMPKSFDLEYEDPRDFPKNCVCTPSNHDTETLRGWWSHTDPTSYYHTILRHVGKPPKELTETLAKEIIQTHLHSKANWAIFLLQDLFAMSDAIKHPDPDRSRINDPANRKNKWQWRMHLYIEELLLAKDYTRTIKTMIKESRR